MSDRNGYIRTIYGRHTHTDDDDDKDDDNDNDDDDDDDDDDDTLIFYSIENAVQIHSRKPPKEMGICLCLVILYFNLPKRIAIPAQPPPPV